MSEDEIRVNVIIAERSYRLIIKKTDEEKGNVSSYLDKTALEGEEDIEKNVSKDGAYYIHHFGVDIVPEVNIL